MIKKRGMMQLPFSMIFSIFLIIVFIVVAIIAIIHFMNLWKVTQYNSFLGEFQDDVDEVWHSLSGSSGDIPYEYELPSSIEYVCFANLSISSSGKYKSFYLELARTGAEDSNLFIYPTKAVEPPYHYIKHIDINVIQQDNPYCIKLNNKKVKINLEKEVGEKLVRVS